jgi:TonB family protein
MKTKMMVMMLLGATFIATNTFANTDTTSVIPTQPDTNDTTLTLETPFIIQEELATFPGGDEALREYFQKNIQYPSVAKSQGIEGKVVAVFTINEQGLIENIQLTTKVGGNCDEEVIEALNNMPAWKPAMQGGHTVRTRITMGFNFHQ